MLALVVSGVFCVGGGEVVIVAGASSISSISVVDVVFRGRDNFII